MTSSAKRGTAGRRNPSPAPVPRLCLDIETFSSADLSKTGVYRYTEALDFMTLLIGYSLNGGPVKVADLASGQPLPQELLNALLSPKVEKWAFNAMFERVCLSRTLRDLGYLGEGKFLNPDSWRCAMIWAQYLGMPMSLAGVGAVLGLDKQKLETGKDLIRFFCMPAKPSLLNDQKPRNLPSTDPNRWKQFVEYNIRDVETEMGIMERFVKYPVPDFVWEEYAMDQRINDRGIRVDMDFVNAALEVDALSREELTQELARLTDIDNPNSAAQIRAWLTEHGQEVENLSKKEVKKLLERQGAEDGIAYDIREVLLLRQQLAKTSVKKYVAIENSVCADGRVRGMFQFYGAARSGRWSGRLVQLQNLPQNHITALDAVRSIVAPRGTVPHGAVRGNGSPGTGSTDPTGSRVPGLSDPYQSYQTLKLLYDSVPDVLSELIRTAFIPAPGKRFIVCDFSAIEARVIAWLAGESWRQEAFAAGEDIYCASASKMFHVPVKKHGVNGHLRQKGKIAELALGYGGGVGALTSMGAIEMGLEEKELQPLVDAWRAANPNIVRLWKNVDNAVKTALRNKTTLKLFNLEFSCRSGMLFIRLPSGRSLSYVQPEFATNRFGGESVRYKGLDSSHKWTWVESYGPKFVENIVQGISRDLLCNAMRNLQSGPTGTVLLEPLFGIVAHVHDEVILEVDPETTVEEIAAKMAICPPWAKGLLLRADGFITDYYRKD